jgi:hypothetical protein
MLPALAMTTFSSISKWAFISLLALGTASLSVGCGDDTGDGGDDDDDTGSGNSGNSGTGNSGNSGTGNSGNSGTGNEGNSGTTCETQWSCINGACGCDAGPNEGNACCDGADPACDGDPMNCDSYCEFCS